MVMKGQYLWIVLVAATSGLHFVNTFVNTGIGEDIAVVRICNATDPVDLDVFNAYMMYHDFERLEAHLTKLSCFLLCIYNEYKWMDRRGSFKPRKIKMWMRRAHLTPIDRELLLHKCITTAEQSDPCTRARHFTDCFWSNHQDADSFAEVDHTFHAIIKKTTL